MQAHREGAACERKKEKRFRKKLQIRFLDIDPGDTLSKAASRLGIKGTKSEKLPDEDKILPEHSSTLPEEDMTLQKGSSNLPDEDMLCSFGMDEEFGFVTMDPAEAMKDPAFRAWVGALLKQVMQVTVNLIRENCSSIDRLVTALLHKIKLTTREIEAELKEKKWAFYSLFPCQESTKTWLNIRQKAPESHWRKMQIRL